MKAKVLYLIIPFIVLVLIFSFALTCTSTSEEEEEGHTTKVEAWAAAQLAVEENLKSPSTASFPWSAEDHVTKVSDDVFEVEGCVDSENSFGAEIRTHFGCTIEFTGEDTYTVKDLQF